MKEALAYFLRSLETEMLTAHKHKMTTPLWTQDLTQNITRIHSLDIGLGIMHRISLVQLMKSL